MNQRVRKVTVSTGIMTTVAGSGSTGFSGDGGDATSAILNDPFGLAVDSSGFLLTREYCGTIDAHNPAFIR